jgi:glycolate oxidase
MTTSAARSLVRDLSRGLDESTSVICDSDVLETYRRDRAPWAPAGVPTVMVAPVCVDDVRRVLAFAAERDVAVVPRGAGSGLSGGANAVNDCIVLSMHRYDAVTAVRAADRLMHVQAGALNATVKTAAARSGLWYSPDPAQLGLLQHRRERRG